MPSIEIETTNAAAQQGLLLKQQRKDRGYGLEQLSIATGLTIGELTAAENDCGRAGIVNRIRRALG
jgi:hypothetical protein